MTNRTIPAEAVEAAKRVAFERYGSRPDTAYLRTILEAAAPYMLSATEWGIFRATDDETATPTENRRYRTREIAERHLRYDYAQAEFWEVRGRRVGEWRK